MRVSAFANYDTTQNAHGEFMYYTTRSNCYVYFGRTSCLSRWMRVAFLCSR